MATGGWGISAWGLSPYGLTATSFVRAQPSTTQSVRLTLSADALFQSRLGNGDAKNPLTFTLQRLDTLEFFTVLQVERVGVGVYDIFTAETLPGATVELALSAPQLRDASGALATAPLTALLKGITVYEAQLVQPSLSRDLRNDANGRLVPSADGGYQTDEGVELLRKKIARRLSTVRGGFLHLPTYGSALPVKGTLTDLELVALARDVKREVLQEPEVSGAKVSVTVDAAQGVVRISLQVTTATKETFAQTIALRDAG